MLLRVSFYLPFQHMNSSSTLSHLHDAGSRHWEAVSNCRSIKENYDSKYNAIEYFIGNINIYGCYHKFRKEQISPVVEAVNQYISAGCVDKLGHLYAHSSLVNPCYF